MPTETTQRDGQAGSQSGPANSWLERLTGTILLVVLAALAWMVSAAIWPGFGRLPSVEHEVVLMLALLATALLLVSLVALLHTRR
jgi:energy-coupling factor transporter transmembrane protein EcfT